MIMERKVVILVLCRKVIAQLFIEHITNNTQMKALGVYGFSEVRNIALVHNPILALVEIPEQHGDPVQEAFDVCGDIKKVCPNCKIMLMCPEKDKKSVDACVEAKKKGYIEDYVFYDTSPIYLTSKLEALLPG